MQRRDFLKQTCTACLSLTAISLFGAGCVATNYITGKINTDGLTISKDDFKIRQSGSASHSSFIIVRNEKLKFPVCVYRKSDSEYSAVWMECTHNGAELQASGDVLVCTAHGSEFSSSGVVKTGPADTNLRTFPVTVNDKQLFIDLRKQS